MIAHRIYLNAIRVPTFHSNRISHLATNIKYCTAPSLGTILYPCADAGHDRSAKLGKPRATKDRSAANPSNIFQVWPGRRR